MALSEASSSDTPEDPQRQEAVLRIVKMFQEALTARNVEWHSPDESPDDCAWIHKFANYFHTELGKRDVSQHESFTAWIIQWMTKHPPSSTHAFPPAPPPPPGVPTTEERLAAAAAKRSNASHSGKARASGKSTRWSPEDVDLLHAEMAMMTSAKALADSKVFASRDTAAIERKMKRERCGPLVSSNGTVRKAEKLPQCTEEQMKTVVIVKAALTARNVEWHSPAESPDDCAWVYEFAKSMHEDTCLESNERASFIAECVEWWVANPPYNSGVPNSHAGVLD